VLRRAYRLLFADDPRPLAERLGREAKRLLVAAALIVLAVLALVVAGIVVLIVYAT
jgi:hypothetical protein